jgi:uncharacterized protein
MKPFSLLIKPASADCNMDCHYCFYLEKSSLYPDQKVHRMSRATLEKMISSYMETEQPCYTFGWQGGEPILMGLDFFKDVVKMQQKYGRSGSMVTNGLQTNASLIDEPFAKHLAEYKFLLGVSLDGPEHIHDHYRKLPGGQGTFRRVMKGIDILRENNVEFNILVLVNDFNVSKVKEIYKFLVENGFYFHQYIPCVEFDDKGRLEQFSINGEQWGNFLIELFNQWYPGDIHKVSIRFFDSIINYFVRGRSTICHMENNCNQYFVVEYNGDIYPCDFFVREDLKLGNINSSNWEELLDSGIYQDFGSAKKEYSFICRSCKYLDLCHGDCLKHRAFSPDNEKRLSTLCSGWKMFYQRSLPVFKSIASGISS